MLCGVMPPENAGTGCPVLERLGTNAPTMEKGIVCDGDALYSDLERSETLTL